MFFNNHSITCLNCYSMEIKYLGEMFGKLWFRCLACKQLFPMSKKLLQK